MLYFKTVILWIVKVRWGDYAGQSCEVQEENIGLLIIFIIFKCIFLYIFYNVHNFIAQEHM